MNRLLISPSLMCADQLSLGSDIDTLVSLGADMLHIDVMDGEFVPNIQLGCELITAVKNKYSVPLDLHLMIQKPEGKIGFFAFGPGDYVSFHYEATSHPLRVADEIKKRGAKPLIALNPATPLCVLEDMLPLIDGVLLMAVNPGYAGQRIVPTAFDKIHRCRELLDRTGNGNKLLQIDGNVSFENAEKMRAFGADCLVCGSSSLFSHDTDMKTAYKRLKSL